MAKGKASIIVEQYFNRKFNSNLPEDIATNHRYIYAVKKAVNTLDVTIDETLTPSGVKALIEDGVNVSIRSGLDDYL